MYGNGVGIMRRMDTPANAEKFMTNAALDTQDNWISILQPLICVFMTSSALNYSTHDQGWIQANAADAPASVKMICLS